jgi:hypothetical protein
MGGFSVYCLLFSVRKSQRKFFNDIIATKLFLYNPSLVFLKNQKRNGRIFFKPEIYPCPFTENRKQKTENQINGGERGIRTLGKSFGPTRDFQSRPFSRSGISPEIKNFIFLRSLLQNSFKKGALFVPDKLTPVAQAFQPV